MLSKDFKEFIGLLNEHKVRYLVVGGYAVAFHGHPRYTKDLIDILTTLKKIKFEDCYTARVEVEIQGVKINFIDLENLKQNKRATGRPQDLADAESLD